MTITILSSKGGVGKSCTAIHLATLAVADGLSVRGVDRDESGAFGSFCAILPGVTFGACPPNVTNQATIIDCPGILNYDTVAPVESADLVLIPLRASLLDFEESVRTRDFIARHAPRATVRLLLTQYSRPDAPDRDDIRQAEGAALCRTIIPYSSEIKRALNNRQTVFESAPNCAAAHAYRRLYQELKPLWLSPPTPAAPDRT